MGLAKLALRSSTDPAKLKVTLDVTNTGKRAGAEVVQVYVGHPTENGEPPHQLRAFAKVQLKPGETKPVTLTLDARSFSTFDTGAAQWLVRPGTYEILAGTSSRDLPQQSSIAVRLTAPVK